MNKARAYSKILFILVATLAWSVGASAQSPADKTLSPYFSIEGGNADSGDDSAVDRLPLKKTDVGVNISGVIAEVLVRQQYQNQGISPINARYIFPASTRAAVHGMRMTIGENVIVAKVKERDIAQKAFDAAKKAGKSASLLKQQRPNVFSMNVANIMPGDQVDIELAYTELFVPTDQTYRFVFPTVVGPRYSNQSEAGAAETDRWVKSPYLKEGQPPVADFNIHVTVSGGMPIQEVSCPTHEAEVEWENETVAHIRLPNAEMKGGNRDFMVDYRLAGKEVMTGLMLYEGEGDDENFFLLMAQPPERVEPADLPPREYIFVVDVSGSMNGFPLNTAKRLLRNLIRGLGSADSFNLVLFAGGSKVMAPHSVPATAANIKLAEQIMDHEQGGGGTELFSALNKALNLPGSDATARTVVTVTDGYIAAEKAVFHLIRSHLNRMNVFAFGIGSSVNRYLIEGMAKAGSGEPFVVTGPRDAGRMAEQFRRYISAPVLTGIRLDYSGFEAYDVEPPAIPDLFAQRPVIVHGKWRGKPAGNITLTGNGGKGVYRQTFDVAQTPSRSTNNVLRYLWARTRIARLSDYRMTATDSENKLAVTNLGLTYNLLTAHTSFIAVQEKVRNTEGQGKDVAQPLPLPAGVSNLAVGNVPEPELWILLVVMVLLVGLQREVRCKLGSWIFDCLGDRKRSQQRAGLHLINIKPNRSRHER